MAILISNKTIEPFVFEKDESRSIKIFLFEQKDVLVRLEKVVSKFISVKGK